MVYLWLAPFFKLAGILAHTSASIEHIAHSCAAIFRCLSPKEENVSIVERLQHLGFTLPDPPEPAGSYTRAVRAGKLIFVSGQLPIVEGEMAFAGKIGAELSVEEGYKACQVCALNALSILRAEAGSLEAIQQVVRISGFVCSASGFTAQPAVVNGASELLSELFGEKGIHARLAVGVSELPLGAAVELEVIASV